MKVLQVVPGMSPMWGGPSVALVGLVRALSNRGVDTALFTTNTDPRGRLDVPLGRPIDQDGATLTYFNIWPATRYAFSLPLALALQQRLRDYDVVHIHWLYNFSSLAAAVIARRAEVPYVLQFNGSIDPHLMERNTFLKRTYIAIAGRQIIDHASALIFTTDMERRSAALGAVTRPSYVVPVGLDWADYAVLPSPGTFRRHYTTIGDRRMVLFLGRVGRQKGLDLLVPAFEKVRTAHPDAHLVIAGPDGEGYGDQVRQCVRQHHLETSVTFTGRVPDELKLAAYVDCDVYVLPSYGENFGATVAEALACRRPVVITDRVNLCEEIAAAEAGVVVECSADAVAAGLNRLLADPKLAERLAENGRLLVRRKFTWDAALEALLPVYRGVVAMHRDRNGDGRG
jgi:glycosyltransferase involved in cell wall biosynthesis